MGILYWALSSVELLYWKGFFDLKKKKLTSSIE